MPDKSDGWDNLDFNALGFKSGLEIHQQLLTDRKLFCNCKAMLRRDPPHAEILRHMRPTLSEMGTYDKKERHLPAIFR
jgi:glutamyl-tRNA(Gln) amidotransferase subunit E